MLDGSAVLAADLALSTMPPATPTPSTYIQPSWKSNRCELNSELKMFCTHDQQPDPVHQTIAAEQQR